MKITCYRTIIDFGVASYDEFWNTGKSRDFLCMPRFKIDLRFWEGNRDGFLYIYLAETLRKCLQTRKIITRSL